MNAIIAVQDLITQNRNRIKILKHQLASHESGENKLSVMAKASTELGLEKSQDALLKNELILKELSKKDLLELEKEQHLKEAIVRKNYYKYQKIRIKRDVVMDNDQKLEAMMIIDELPHDIDIEDNELYAIAETTINLHLRVHSALYDEFQDIKNDWNELHKDIDSKNVDRLGMLNLHIPILVLHLTVLISNIEENIEENNLDDFKGLPAFEDWWIHELWINHQAYFGLYKWRSIIGSLCITADQKRAWNIIFSNWVFIKKMINSKGSLGFEFNFAFDTLLEKYVNLKEELTTKNLIVMENIVEKITAQEDFSKYKTTHQIETPYLKFKRDKINYKEE
ncbi:MAG: hypothetical protein WA945_04410 [Arcobacteraceae bacterium]